MDKIKILLLGMTGLGNNVLNVLREADFVRLVGVFTPPEENFKFPYYKCQKLQTLVKKHKIALYEGLLLRKKSTQDLVAGLSPDLIVVGSFKQIIPANIIALPKLGVINVHPSLLPKYRGATPITWAIMNGDKETGVTVHFIEDERIDSGRIIAQERVKILPYYTDGMLRKKLAKLSEKVLKKALYAIRAKTKRSFVIQNRAKTAYYPKRTLNDAKIDINSSFEETVRKINAFTPYPGARLEYGGKKFIADRVIRLNLKKLPAKNKKHVDVKSPHGILRFRITKKNP